MSGGKFRNSPVLRMLGITVGFGPIEAILQGELHDYLPQILDGHSSNGQEGKALLAVNEDELAFLDEGLCVR